MRCAIGILWLCGWVLSAHAVTVVDDSGETVFLPVAARRIVTLSPHVTELAFQAGAGRHVVAVSAYSDFPLQVNDLPKLGSAGQIDMERLLALQPDLALVWASGTPRYQQQQLKRLGIAVFVSEPRTLEDIARSMERIGRLSGTEREAGRAAREFRQRLARLDATAAMQGTHASPAAVFYQVWPNPLMTVNEQHVISDIVRRCGGRNVMADFPVLSGHVDEEQVLLRNPGLIIAARNYKEEAPNAHWRRWPWLTAVHNGQLHTVAADSMHRPGPRILDGMASVCRMLAGRRNSNGQ